MGHCLLPYDVGQKYFFSPRMAYRVKIRKWEQKDQKNFMTRGRIAHRYMELAKYGSFPKSLNLISVSFSLVSGNFVYS